MAYNRNRFWSFSVEFLNNLIVSGLAETENKVVGCQGLEGGGNGELLFGRYKWTV